MEDIVNVLVSKYSRPVISIASILHNFNQVRLKFNKLSSLYVSEIVMELLSSVLVVGVKQCQFLVSFRGDCHLYTLSCTKCGKAMHEIQYPIMILLQLAPRIILDHFGLRTSSWNEEVLTKLQSDRESEYRKNPAHILFSSADGMITSLKNMEIVQLNEPTMIRCKFGIGADHVKDGQLDKREIAKEQKTQINNANALKMDASLQDKTQHGNMQLTWHCKV